MKIHRVIVLAQLNIDLVTIGKWHLEKGDFRIAAGNCSLIVTCTETKVK